MDHKRQGRKKTTHRKALIAVGGTLAGLLAALAAILIFTDWFAPAPAGNAVLAPVAIPDAEELRARRYGLTDAQDARIYFARLLASKYIGLPDAVCDPPELTEGKWHARAAGADGTEASAAFDPEGVITSLSIDPPAAGGMQSSETPYDLFNGGSAIIDYARAFVYEYLPDITIVSGHIAQDQTGGGRRIVVCRTANRFADPAYEFTVQVAPEMRILGFRLLVGEDEGLVRVSRMAVSEPLDALPDDMPAADTANPSMDEAEEIARNALCRAYDIPESEARTYTVVCVTLYTDLRHTWYGYSPVAPYWMVSFRLPGSDDRVYSDYNVLIDAATGEVLRIFDPSNNSNG